MGQPSHIRAGPNSYITGIDGVYSIFIDAGDYIIASGLNEGFADRFAKYLEETGYEKPLRYVISAQHAGPHIGGIPDAIALGATIIAPANHLEDFSKRFPSMASWSRVIALKDKLVLGQVEVFPVTTTSSDYLALLYIPEGKIIFQTDSYGSIYQDAPGFAGIGGVSLMNEIIRLGIEVEEVAFVYSPYLEPFSNFEKAVERFIENPCFETRPIC